MKNKGPVSAPEDEVPEEITENFFQLNKELISTLNVTVLKKGVARIELEMKSNKTNLRYAITDCHRYTILPSPYHINCGSTDC